MCTCGRQPLLPLLTPIYAKTNFVVKLSGKHEIAANGSLQSGWRVDYTNDKQTISLICRLPYKSIVYAISAA